MERLLREELLCCGVHVPGLLLHLQMSAAHEGKFFVSTIKAGASHHSKGPVKKQLRAVYGIIKAVESGITLPKLVCRPGLESINTLIIRLPVCL